jgi:hypothetical protein
MFENPKICGKNLKQLFVIINLYQNLIICVLV